MAVVADQRFRTIGERPRARVGLGRAARDGGSALLESGQLGPALCVAERVVPREQRGESRVDSGGSRREARSRGCERPGNGRELPGTCERLLSTAGDRRRPGGERLGTGRRGGRAVPER
ncbi:hypothetical protein [Rathayibacter rathayi]|uniref:hypothetical protein n=1 Tax=Rathayibacter rathayi TaxID=33887 RepID=UPI000CE90709|nr:hypothetical protein [Rathayibacter rathayi]PPG67435.1 hypothetical protein C5C02_09815 [Rathayibacter rathayi]PPG75855.1 hypothetical protein C5C23_09070 [Rathayibacter rathayi]PPI76116.1 hypothetical protein C5E03_11480 [Rathayibacter rathayi]